MAAIPRSKTSASASSGLSLQTKTTRFAEATAVVSPHTPVGPSQFSYPSKAVVRQPQQGPAEVDFGASIDRAASRTDSHANQHYTSDPAEMPPSPPPKTPFTAMPLMSPTWKEEETLEKAESHTDKEQVKDLKIKTRVRIAKFLLRGVNFSCSLIVLAMLSTSLTIFRATKSIPPRYVGNTKLNPWAPKQQTWPQIVVLCIACVSLLITVVVLWHHCRSGRRRARKADGYYNTFAVGAWVFSVIMWVVGATVLQHTRNVGANQDFWGWSCVKNTRETVFSDQIHYSLICRLQSWSLVCCIIEVVVETITIAIYSVIAYRVWSKRRLTKAMSGRNQARSDLYLAQLKASAPNTPAPWSQDKKDALPSSETTVVADSPYGPREPFVLQPAPTSRGAAPNVTPSPPVGSAVSASEAERPLSPRAEVQHAHASLAPGEQVYASVPIPRGYDG